MDAEMIDKVRRSFVPTLEQARGAARGALADVLAAQPVTQHTFVAVLVYGRSLRRRSWTDTVELGASLLERMRGRHLRADTPLESARYALVERVVDATPRRCTACTVRARETLCPNCRGGLVLPLVDCPPTCKKGWVPCATCEGTGLVQAVIVRHVEDDVTVTRAVALPSEPAVPWLEDRLHADALRAGTPPLGLMLSATADAGSPYRGAKPAPPRFLDLPLQAWDAARRKAESMQRAAGSHRIEFRAFGWPIYTASWYGQEVALAMGFDWSPRFFVRET